MLIRKIAVLTVMLIVLLIGNTSAQIKNYNLEAEMYIDTVKFVDDHGEIVVSTKPDKFLFKIQGNTLVVSNNKREVNDPKYYPFEVEDYEFELMDIVSHRGTQTKAIIIATTENHLVKLLYVDGNIHYVIIMPIIGASTHLIFNPGT